VGVESIGKVFTLPFIPSPHREGKKGKRGDFKIHPNLPLQKEGIGKGRREKRERKISHFCKGG